MEDRRAKANGKKVWVIKAGFPETPQKKWWSEYCFARSLKKYLERSGFYVVVEGIEEWDRGGYADVVVVMRGHAEYFPDRKNRDCIYIMWNLSHPDTIAEEEYNAYDLVCISSITHMEKMEKRLNVPVKWLPMCADTELFYPSEDTEKEPEYDWIFVGNSRYVKRKSVVWSIKNGIPLKIWGGNWEKVLPEISEHVVAENIPNDDLPELYRNAKVTVDDHYDDMLENGFINTRIIEAFACGLPVISDYSEAFQRMFGDAILCYRDEAEFIAQTKKVIENYTEIKEKVLDLWPLLQETYSFQACAEKLKEFAEETESYRQKCICSIKSLNRIDRFDRKSDLVCKQRDMSDVKVSVIVPVYNEEKYLEECLDSVIGQSLKEIEIICIDDGSSDSSLRILEEYAKKDQRISVYTQGNCGLSVSRNRGMDKASGKYIYLIDSDDVLEINALENLYEISQKEQLDILYFNGVSFYEDEDVKKEHPEFEGYYLRKKDYPKCCTGPQMLVKMRCEGEYRSSAVMQFFKHDFLKKNHICFEPGVLQEDNCFSFCAALLAERSGYTSGAYYHRRVHRDSIMGGDIRMEHVYGYFKGLVGMLSFVEKHGVDEETADAAFDILKGMHHNARKFYSRLNLAEKDAFYFLSGIERIQFFLLVSSESFPDNRNLIRKNVVLNQKLKKTYSEKSELNRKLQQTYAEKSEINGKLQITYKEKYDRGLRITELEEEIRSIKKSKTYRLARMIGMPVRHLRRIISGVFGGKKHG